MKGKIKMNERDTSELFLAIFKKADEIKAFVAELTVLYRHQIEQLEEANADLTSKKNWCNARARNVLNKSERLFKALERIKQAAETEENKCEASFDFAVEIARLASSALQEWEANNG